MPQTKEEKREYQKQYRLKNQEKIAIYRKSYNKQYRIDNKEYYKEYQKEYNKTPQWKKTYSLSNWKKHGLIGNYDEIYERYLNTNECDNCNIKFSIIGDGIGRFKCMDHDHITGLFRNVLCNTCNLKRG
tara:strand:+ start:127 stop:513 length:387 start_codon:yes stop_codon:yes gene_type:complete